MTEPILLKDIFILAILADNCCYQRDIMSTHRRGRLWMNFLAATTKRLVAPTQHNRPFQLNQSHQTLTYLYSQSI